MKGSLLIVDDEPLIRKGLAKLVESNPLGWTVVGEAGNGREAVAKLDELKPDLVMTDIRMPLMDGLELAGYISENRPETAVIILTGYRDFEYAQKAIAYSVKQFLLKPCPEEEVCRVLQLAYGQYREQADARERETVQRRAKEDQLLRSVLLRLPYDAEEAALLEKKLAGREVWLLQVDSYFPPEREFRSKDLKLLQFAIGNILQEKLAALPEDSRWITLEYDSFAFFLPPDRENAQFFSEAAGIVQKLLGITLTAKRCGIPQSLRETVAWLNALLRGREDNGNTEADEGKAGPRELPLNETKVRLIRSELTALLLLGRPGELKDYLAGILHSIRQPSVSLDSAKIEAFCMAMAMHDVMRKELEADPAVTGDMGSRVAELNLIYTSQDVEQWLDGQTRVFNQALLHWQTARNSGLINRAVRYIEEHYAEECSLAAVAAHTHLSANYFGNLFKKETGESFSGYVSRFRLDKAKFLLKNTDMKIAEIAQAVGYPDSNYFATAFRQTIGLPPTEYRKQGC
ncbi:MAG: response regulator [Paenibacillaceae bacterium]|jgi:two-component system response regulator YesN|nr:response regulator [Paenibacillaceae bacterium]